MARKIHPRVWIQPSGYVSGTFFLLLAALVPLSWHWGTSSPSWKLDQIWVLGAELRPEGFYRAFFEPDSALATYQVDLPPLLDSLERDPYVKGARVSHVFPDVIKLELVERRPLAALNTHPILLIDEEGVILPMTDPKLLTRVPMLSNMNTAPELYPIGEQTLSVKVLDAVHLLATVQNEFPRLYRELSGIRFNPRDEVEMILTEHPTRIFLGAEDFRRKIISLREFRRALPTGVSLSSFQSLDLRFAKQIVAKEWM
ncbi:MAG: hypothetical protein D6762_09525 [Candidatus Neomarinimicrobiota bacterium]|nr:MAG: hypothetical protein D6762_09525 [Candidatus Neomarinimicrobiota bacterium]